MDNLTQTAVSVMWKPKRICVEHKSYDKEENAVIFRQYFVNTGSAVAQWLRYCATNRKVTGSIPDGVIEIFH